MSRAEEDAKALLELAMQRGVHHVIVCVGYEDGNHYTAWKGTALALRGLFEICRGVIKKHFSSKTIAQGQVVPTPPALAGQGGNGGHGFVSVSFVGPGGGAAGGSAGSSYGSNGQGGAGR